jgi:uncharacterized protein (DUF1501 family)
MFFVSGGLKQKGLLNALPDLSQLDDGDLQFRMDFRQVYATVLNQWLGMDAAAILGNPFQPLHFL